MIARFRVLLLQVLSIPVGADLLPFDLVVDGTTIRVCPPMKAKTSIGDLLLTHAPLFEIAAKLAPAEQESSDRILMDDVCTVDANMLQLEISAVGFDRRKGIDDMSFQNEVSIFFKALNCVLARLRTVTRTGSLKSISPDQTVWSINYLNDDGSELPKQEGLFRGRVSTNFKIGAIGVNSETWRFTQSLPGELVLRTWEALILDAQAALPEIGPSIVLAATALEIFISYALDILESRFQSPLPAGMWDWINNKDDFYKEPSPEERFDFLLKTFSGKSLKDETTLWDAFKLIRNARNKFVHEGKALVGGNPVDAAKAAQLVARAADIIAWVEKLLPPEFQRKQLSVTQFKFHISIRG